MIPQTSGGNYLSDVVVSDHFLDPDHLDDFNFKRHEAGPIGLNDPSEGNMYQNWIGRYVPATGDFTLEAPNTPATVVLTVADVSEFDFTFDQNGNPFICFVENGVTKWWWWDTALPGTTISTLGSDILTPRCGLDDKREFTSGSSDIIFAYVKNGGLLFRMERERYTVEYTLMDPFLHPVYELPAVLKRIGMNKVWRFQFLCDLANPLDWCVYKG